MLAAAAIALCLSTVAAAPAADLSAQVNDAAMISSVRRRRRPERAALHAPQRVAAPLVGSGRPRPPLRRPPPRPTPPPQINSARAGWTAAASPKFFNMSLAEAKRLMGARRDPARRAALPRSTLALPTAIPASFNATAAWPACAGVIGHIRDQSDCGCCWAFASTESFNDRHCIATNGSKTELLSPQDTCSCCNGAHGCGSDGGCNGGFTEDAFNCAPGAHAGGLASLGAPR